MAITLIHIEEKETDVNIGAHLMADALKGRFDRALIITADTDINGAVDLARKEAQKVEINIVAPTGRYKFNSKAKFEVALGKVRDSLLPERCHLQNGAVIERPDKYMP